MDFFYEEFNTCLGDVIDSLKMLLYHRHADIFERLDFEKDEVYQEPLLYAYLIQDEDKWLDSIIYGYERNKKSQIKVFSNKNGVVYLPQVGYFKTNNPSEELFFGIVDGDYKLSKGKGNIQYEFEPLFYLDGGFELIKYQHPLLESLFRNEENHIIEVGVETVYERHINHFNRAFEVIKNHYSDYAKLLEQNVKKVMIFEGNVNSFAAIQAHNMIFLSVQSEDDDIFFLDHILHEGAHVIFNTLTYNTKDKLFKVPFNADLSQFTGNPNDKGMLYGRFHGLFTQTNINSCMEICIRENVYQGRQQHELLGRFSSNMKRYNAAIKCFDKSEMYDSEGGKWYDFFKSKNAGLYSRNYSLVEAYNVSGQPYIFNYKIFVEENGSA